MYFQVAKSTGRKSRLFHERDISVLQCYPTLEKTLLAYSKAGKVIDPKVLLTEEGYVFVFQARGVSGQLALYGVRRERPRTWKSFDRMLAWLRVRRLLAALSLHVEQPTRIVPLLTTKGASYDRDQ
jgi:hypothetical protein